MPKQLNVNMSFTADTSQARKQIQDLQATLDNLISGSIKGNIGQKMDADLQKSITSAKQLRDMIAEASNTKTGNLDLSKFSQQIEKSGRSVQQYARDLSNLGPEGSQAFMQLAQSVAAAEVPMKKTFGILDQFKVTLANAARWQISSSVLHGLMGAVQGAYGYAQDLNKSLTDIRIVTGQSTDEMARFAEQANKSAQALSTSTLAYTDAALIYYQQGLDADAVAARTETTLKMSNVTGESAEEVSSYMTAIWNNFYDGSQSIESFADKITALGAATASSSREIAGGLQQFAAIANTVGLSYDYAATALATIVARTRQSESTVGNGLRTIFARLSSLKQGGTEDGVDLTKYTKALQQVGINVLDQNGQLKEMDSILDDIGEKWQSLNKNQQVALAQTVGGVRQYATIMALFDDWDQFQKNLAISENAEGTLEEQSERFEESWLGAQKRVQAAWQAIYQDLIDDKFFIGLLDNIAKLLQGLDSIIDSIGGLKGVLPTVGALLTTIFAKDLANGIETAVHNFKVFTGQAEDDANRVAIAFRDAGYELAKNLSDQGFEAQAKGLKDQIDFTLKLRENAASITEENRKWLLSLNEITKEYANAWAEAEKLKEIAETNQANVASRARDIVADSVDNSGEKIKAREDVSKALNIENFNSTIEEFKSNQGGLGTISEDIQNTLKQGSLSFREYANSLRAINASTNPAIDYQVGLRDAIDNTIRVLESSHPSDEEKIATLKELAKIFQEAKDSSTSLNEYLRDDAVTAAKELALNYQLTEEQTKKLIEAFKQAADGAVELSERTKEADQAQANYNLRLKEAQIEFEQAKNKVASYADQIVSTARALSQLMAGFTALSKAWDTWTNKDLKLTPMERFQKSIPSLLTGLPMVISGFKNLTKEGTLLGGAIDKVSMIFLEGVASSGKLTGGFGAVGKAAVGLMGNLLPILGWLALAAAAIYALKKAWDAFYATTADGKLEAANKRLEESKEKADEAAEAYANLKSTLEEYADVQKEISEMDPGLDKTDAVLEENQKILDLLTENDLWDKIGPIEYDDNGLIKLTELQQEAIQKDLAREKILTRQAELQDKINQLKAQEVKDQQASYQGEKFQIQSMDKDSAVKDEEGNTLYYTRSSLKDVSSDIARILTNNDLTIGSNSEDIKQALLNSGDEDIKKSIDSIMKTVESIKSSEEKTAEFNQLQQDNVNSDQAIHAYELQYAQGAIGESLVEEVSYAPARQALLEAFAQLGPDAQQRIQEGIESGTLTFAEAFGNEGIDVAQKIKDAMLEAETGAADRAATAFQSEGDLYFSEDDDVAQKQIDFIMSLSDEELAQYGGWVGLQEAINNVAQQHDIELNVKASDFSQLKSSVKDEDLMQEVEQFADYLEDHLDTIDDLSDHLKDCRAELEKIAYSIMRFDDAIQDVTENYDDWSAALKAGGLRAAGVFDDLAKAYGNVLDIDGSLLSSKFLDVTKNLDDMKLAIQGDEDAYNRLQEAAARDYMAETIGSSVNQINELYDVINSYADELSKLNPGDVLPEADFSGLYAALNEYLATLGLSVDQAQALMSMFGWDADVNSFETKDVDKTEGTDVIAKAEKTDEIAEPNVASLGLPGGGTMSGTLPVYGIKVHGEPSDLGSAEKTTTATVVGIKPGGLHKKTGGNVKFSKSTHGGGGVSPSKGKSGGGGGKGGGSPKKKTVKEHAKKEKVEDRYHNIKSAIDAVSKSLARLNKLQDRAYGKSKLKYMDQEIDKLKEQVKLTDQYIKEARQYLALDRKNLEGTGMGAIFDTDGRLVNYEQVLQKMVESYNKAVDAYNGSVDAFNAGAQEEADNTALENAKKQLDKAKEIYDDNKKILDQYEKTYQELQTQVDKKVELLNEIYDKKLAKVVWKVDIQLEVNDADIKYLEWLNKQLEKSSGHATDILANLSKAALDTEKDIAAVNQGLVELFSNHGIQLDFDNLDPAQLVSKLREFMAKEGLGSELTEEEAKQIRDWNDKLMEYIDNWVNYWEEAHKKIDETFKDYNDKIDKEIDKLEEFTDILDHYNKIIDLTGAQLGMSDEDVLRIHDAKIRNGENELRALRAEREEVSALLQEAQTNLANAETEEAKKLWEGHVQEIEDRLNELDKNIRSQWENVLEWAQDRFDKALEAAAKSYEDRFDNLTLLMDRFDRQKEADHLFLDDYEKYHELNKDAKELEKMIDNTNNTLMRSKYADYLDKVRGYMSSGVKLSQAQADLIAKRVELLKAEDDLLNARNAKNTVRMTRDNEGNFSYTYTADQDAIDDAELGYNDAFYNLQKSTRDYQEETQGDMLNHLNDFMTRSQELIKQRQSGEITPDQYNQAMAELQAQHEQYMQWYLEQMGFFYDEEGTLRDEDLANLEEILEIKLADYDDFITEYEDSILGRLFDDVDSEYEFVENAISAEEQLLADNTEAAQQWEYDIQEICAAAGVDVDKFRETVLTDLAQIDQKSIETKEKVTEMAKKMKEDMDEIMKKALQMDQDWANRMQSMRNQIAATVLAMNTMLAMLANVTDYEYKAGQAAMYAAGAFTQMGNAAAVAAEQVNALADALNNVAGAGSGNRGGGGSGPYKTTATVTPKIIGYDVRGIPIFDSGKQVSPGGSNIYDNNHNVIDYLIGSGSSVKLQQEQIKSSKSWWQSSNIWEMLKNVFKGDTGGMTAAWGPEGKFAMLHEKELVLNKEDTANILNVVDSVRSMTSNLGNNALDNLAKAITGSGSLALAGTGTLDQNVHIEASFPNVQSHSEIELALNNLINSASQYVNRR